MIHFSYLPIRAAKLGDINLMKSLMADKAHICNVSTTRSVADATKAIDEAVRNQDLPMIKLICDFTEGKLKDKKYCEL